MFEGIGGLNRLGPEAQPARAADDPGLWEHVFLFVAFLVFVGAFRTILSSSAIEQVGDAAPEQTFMRFAVYAVAILLAFRSCRAEVLDLIVGNKLLIAVLAYTVMSSLWAVDSGISLRRSVALSLSGVFCAYAVLRFPLYRILEMALLAVAVAVAVGFVADLFLLERHSDGRMRGIFASPTFSGRIAAVGILILVALWRVPGFLQRYDLVILGLLVLFLYQTNAISPMVALFVALASFVLIWSRSKPEVILKRSVVLGLLALPCLAVAVTFFGDILDAMGRDATLTHRIFVWEAALDKGPESVFLGSGFRSFWIWPYANDVMYNVFGSRNSRLGNGHSGYIDLWLELGFVGVALVAALFVQLAVRSYRVLMARPDPVVGFFPALLVFILIYSLPELVILEHSEITWMMFMIGILALSRPVLRLNANRQPQSETA
ncbi:MAG: O-antigen ligase family protein [Alphaproteobacteria bacterium]